LGTYIDRALSAKTDNRPEFQRMINDGAKTVTFDEINSSDLDGFGCNSKKYVTSQSL
jgi:Resolvase, N terminal domain.